MIDTTLFMQALPFLLKGAFVTIQITGLGCCIGFSLGTIIGIALTSPYALLRQIVSLYSIVIRGTPMLIQIYFVVYVLPQLTISISPFWGAVLAIGLNSSAYVGQIIKSGIASVGKGQIEAAKVLGLNTWQIIVYIILPQAIRTVLPALGNEFVTLIKDSSLASIVGVVELSKEGAFIISRTYDALTVYTAVALIYLFLTTIPSIIINYLEKRMDTNAHY